MTDYVARLLSDTQPAYDRYVELQDEMQLPEVAGDGRLYRRLADKARSLRPQAEAHLALKRIADQLEEAQEARLHATGEWIALYQEECERLGKALEETAAQVGAGLRYASDGGDLPCVVRIRPDKGSADLAEAIARSYQRYLGRHEISCVLTPEDKALRLDVGAGGYGRLRLEAGSNKRVQGGAVTVTVMPEVPQGKVEIDEEDVRVDIYRSSGKGGQNINKVETAVRLTHLPTGTVVTCQDERSQLANKRRAMERLLERLQAQREALTHRRYMAEREGQLADRSNAVRVWDEQKGLVRDPRTKVSVPLKEAVRGEIDPLVVALNTQDKL